MGSTTIWMVSTMSVLFGLVVLTLAEGARRRSANLRFEHEVHRAWYAPRRSPRSTHRRHPAHAVVPAATRRRGPGHRHAA